MIWRILDSLLIIIGFLSYLVLSFAILLIIILTPELLFLLVIISMVRFIIFIRMLGEDDENIYKY